MKNEVALGDISRIGLGQTFRGKAESSGHTDGAKLIQIKDISEGFFGDTDSLPFANVELTKLKVRLTKGDILLPVRGARLEAMSYKPSTESVATTTNQVAVISVNQEIAAPEFILWYLNSELGRATMSRISSGSTVASIKLSDLTSLRLPLPKMPEQQRIADIYTNRLRQNLTLRKMISVGTKISDQICGEILAGDLNAKG